MTPAEFQRTMTELLHLWCDRHALKPLRAILPHYPMHNGFTDEWVDLAVALKTVRMQLGPTLTEAEFYAVVKLQHAAEAALAK